MVCPASDLQGPLLAPLEVRAGLTQVQDMPDRLHLRVSVVCPPHSVPKEWMRE